MEWRGRFLDKRKIAPRQLAALVFLSLLTLGAETLPARLAFG